MGGGTRRQAAAANAARRADKANQIPEYSDAMTRLWGIEQVAEYACYSITQARKLVAQPDFPAVVRLWNGAHPRWIAREVVEWCEARKEAA